MKKPVVLICDDNTSIHESLTDYLRVEGFDSISVYDGESAVAEALKGSADILVLDVMLPRMFGTDVCRKIRETSDIPIIMLSAKGEDSDRVIGLELGADDYVVKPFSQRELVLRIKKLLERKYPKPGRSEAVRCGNISVWKDTHLALVNGEKLELLPKEFELLLYFCSNPDRVLSRERLLDDVWGFSYAGDTRAVDAQVKRLRQKLGGTDADHSIKTVYGFGYKFEAGKP